MGGAASPSDLDVFRTPVMDGYEATRRIKATVRGRATAHQFRFADIMNASA